MHPEDLPKIRAVIHDHLIHGKNVLQNFGFATLWEYRYCIARGKACATLGMPLRMSGILSDLRKTSVQMHKSSN